MVYWLNGEPTVSALPDFQFETGICLRNARTAAFRLCPSGRSWHLIGRLADGTPFNLFYSNTVTSWASPARLSAGLRKKILARVREEIRYAAALPPYVTEYDYTTRALTTHEEDAEFSEIFARWDREVWRGQYLGDREEDYLDLEVPFAEKDQAKALGAQWDGPRRTWRVHRSKDLQTFARWLPSERQAPADGPLGGPPAQGSMS